MKRFLEGVRLVSLAAVLGGLAACGGCGGGEDGGDAAGAVAAGGGAAEDPCGGLSLRAAAELLDTTAEDLDRRAEPAAPISCAFSSRSDPSRVLAYSVRWASSEAEAQARLEAMVEVMRGISPVEVVEAPTGAEYFGTGPRARRALARDGRAVVDVIEPTEPELQRRTLAAIVGGQ